MTIYSVIPNDNEFDVPPTIIVGLWRVECVDEHDRYVLTRVSRQDFTPIQEMDSSELNVVQDKEYQNQESLSLKEANQCEVHVPGFVFTSGMILEFQPVFKNEEERNARRIFLDLYRTYASCQKITVLCGDCILFDNSKNKTDWYRCDVIDQVNI